MYNGGKQEVHDMTGIRRAAAILGTALAIAGISAGAVFADSNGGNINVSGTTDHSIYEAGQTVNVTGTVNGDVTCLAQTVDIDATVNGDVLCAAQTVTVNGTIH